ncbi:MAG: hypothetical protein ACO3PV_03070, partial [Pseudohongiellaceae bacterium]
PGQILAQVPRPIPPQVLGAQRRNPHNAALQDPRRGAAQAPRPGTAAPLVRQPTHVLVGARAVPLPPGRLVFGAADDADAARVLPLPGLAPGQALILQRTRTQLVLELRSLDMVQVNAASAGTGTALQLGDRIDAGNGAALLQLIEVE